MAQLEDQLRQNLLLAFISVEVRIRPSIKRVFSSFC
nr:MAG TPA: hypothetical protein [Bacteriophage sp.]